MSIPKNRNKLIRWISRSWVSILLIAIACNSDLTDDPIPVVLFSDLTININAPEYQKLLVDGGYKEMNTLGVRGVILYRRSSTSILAFERNCSYHPNDACATVNVHSSGLYLIDPCCGSNFGFTDGAPTGGVAWRPLRRYRTEFTGISLTITDEIITN